MSEETGEGFYGEHGYLRRVCPTCGATYWSIGGADTCTDSPCSEYAIWDGGVFGRSYTMDGMREAFLRFFEERGHERMDPYPVVARWRDDVYLTIASIAVFQPHVTSGTVPPPANPLVISQPCIRLNDLDSVGRTGRHLTSFEMMANHAFNEEREVYWIEGTLRYCHELLLSLGADERGIVYKENPWVGGGNAGEAVEVIVGGLELATLVFMHYREDPDGDVVLKGQRFSPMPRRIVDTGYGLERFVWASNAAVTVYDAAFPDLVSAIVEEGAVDRPEDAVLSRAVTLSAMGIPAGEIIGRLAAEFGNEPDPLSAALRRMEAVYTVADHVRTLVRMLGDGIVPSSSRAGYLARLVIRRAERARAALGLGPLSALAARHIEEDLSGYRDHIDRIVEILDIEADRFAQTLERGRRMVERRVEDGLTEEVLLDFYDTHGIPPGVVAEVAEERGIELDIPVGLLSRVAERHMHAGRQVPEPEPELPATRRLYYEEPADEFDATVVHVDGDRVILDATQFYPDGGGQPGDHGTLEADGSTYEVVDTVKAGEAVVHVVPGHALAVGDRVHGRIDTERRMALARHHTTTHIVLSAARRLLGPHVWQAGSQLDVDRSRLDVTHYRPMTEEEVREIEETANRVVLEDVPVEIMYLDRNEADARYGPVLYQGGPPAGPTVRIVRVDDFEVEACGGTHVPSTGHIGMVRILGVERVQDGVERIHFASGLAALRAVAEESALLEEAARALGVQPSALPRTARRFFEEWKDLRKRVEELSAMISDMLLDSALRDADMVGGVPVVVTTLDDDLAMALAKGLQERGDPAVMILGTLNGRIVVSSSHPDVDAVEIVREASAVMGGGGGGNDRIAQGGGPRRERLGDALKAGVRAARGRLG